MLHSWWVEGGKSDSDDKEISKREGGGGEEKVEVWTEGLSLVSQLYGKKKKDVFKWKIWYDSTWKLC